MISSPTDRRPATRETERERLILLCQLDRARIELMLRGPARLKPPGDILGLAQGLLQAARLAPGAAGRWAHFLSTVGRYLQPFL